MCIYVITTAKGVIADPDGFGALKDPFTIGYYTSLEEAESAILENRCDMHELAERFALIEPVNEGLYGCNIDSKWFEWSDRDRGYQPIEKPEDLRNICGFSFA